MEAAGFAAVLHLPAGPALKAVARRLCGSWSPPGGSSGLSDAGSVAATEKVERVGGLRCFGKGPGQERGRARAAGTGSAVRTAPVIVGPRGLEAVTSKIRCGRGLVREDSLAAVC